jgi:flavin reductase (DIM6/NTAB) family NADH-FMN oxidoreductase RutF
VDIDLSKLRRSEAYALLTSFIVPRAIALVSTRDAQGHTNVAPFSYFSGLGSDPPLITLGIGNRRDGSEKDTLRIARQTGVLCVNLVEEELAEPMNQTSGDYAPDVSEFEAAGLTAADCAVIDCARVVESRAHLECRLVDVHTYGDEHKTNLVVAQVVHAVVEDELIDEEARSPRLHPRRARPLARLGGVNYAKLGERLQIARPKV